LKLEISRDHIFKQETLRRLEGSIPFFKNPFFLFKKKSENREANESKSLMENFQTVYLGYSA